MKQLTTVDAELIGIAIGQEDDGKWYVQTTDIGKEIGLSDGIEEGLETKEEALELAKQYVDKYGFQLFDWSTR